MTVKIINIYTFIQRSILLTVAVLLSACSTLNKPNLNHLASEQVANFESQAELKEYVKNVSALINYRNVKRKEHYHTLYGDDIERIEVTGSKVDSTFVNIKNNQVEGVEEGGIIKAYSDFLIILRQGKIYSIRISEHGSNKLQHLSEIDIAQSGWSKDVWYDELLVTKGVLLVLGYNYSLEATQILRFNIDDIGNITYQDGIAIKSNDYYSSYNYASRLFKGKFLTYLPIELLSDNRKKPKDFKVNIPQYAKLQKNTEGNLVWKDIIKPSDIQKPNQIITEPILHTFITCNPLSESFNCTGKGLISSNNYQYFVSQSAFYLWTYALPKSLVTDFNYDEIINMHFKSKGDSNLIEESTLFKLAHFGDKLKTIKVEGLPIDQFSFTEKGKDLYVVSISNPHSENNEQARLYKITKDDFDLPHGSKISPIKTWQLSPYFLNNRFVNNWLALGYYTDTSGGFRSKLTVKPNFSVNLQSLSSDETLNIKLDHTADRIEPIDNKLFISGIDKDFNFNVSVISLKNTPFIQAKGVFNDFLESESRSHAFNFKQFHNQFSIAGITTFKRADSAGNTLLNKFYWDEDIPANITFFGFTDDYQVTKAGEIESHEQQISIESDCEASCVNWYGNSRPFFIDERVFALIGDELIESQLIDEKLIEIKRINIKNNF